MVVWDRLSTHTSKTKQALVAERERLTVILLPRCAPDLGPVEGIWPLLRRRCQANTAFTDSAHLMRALRWGLRQVHYRPDLIDGCLAGTRPTLPTPRLQRQEDQDQERLGLVVHEDLRLHRALSGWSGSDDRSGHAD
ncbi:hypothetical protein C1I97_33295 [Streptomyces sp. NTH33]|nr:hypothetical protein C1I97_33295 [Streptomyces sp. NTH33]